MPTQYTSVRIDRPTADRLRALSQQTGAPVTELLRTLSYARVGDVLQLATLRGAAEAVAVDGGRVTRA